MGIYSVLDISKHLMKQRVQFEQHSDHLGERQAWSSSLSTFGSVAGVMGEKDTPAVSFSYCKMTWGTYLPPGQPPQKDGTDPVHRFMDFKVISSDLLHSTGHRPSPNNSSIKPNSPWQDNLDSSSAAAPTHAV